MVPEGYGWCSKTSSSNNDWLQIDFGKVIKVCGVATQGDRYGNDWTTHFKLSFSADGSSWTPYKDKNNMEVVISYFVLNAFVTNNMTTCIEPHSYTM